MKYKIIGVLAIVLFTLQSWGQGIVDEFVTDNALEIKVDFNGLIAADIGVTFENVDGLAPGALGLSVTQVIPTDAALLARLPAGGLVSIPVAFPVVLSIDPPDDSDLMLRGTAVVSFHTHNLDYIPGTPLRLFKAEHGGDFTDITDRMGSGSYRVRGSGGNFSEFMIVADLRPTASVVVEKFSELNSLLTAHQNDIDSTLFASLSSLITTAQSNFSANGFADSIKQLSQFDVLVKKSTGGEIPDVWRPRGDLTNAAGQLRAKAGSLRFSLSLLANNL